MNIIKDSDRLNSLNELNILDSIEEKEYDSITKLAANICKTPISLISFVTEKRQFFKSHHGLNIRETPISHSFCKHAIEENTKPFIVEDARKDSRFKDNPLVLSNPNIVFYAGAPLITHNGLILGTLCVIDKQPRKLTEEQLNALQSLSEQVIHLLNLRKANIKLRKNEIQLKEKSERLRNIIEATQVGIWEWNVQTGEVSINDRYAEIVGYTHKELEPINISTWNRLIHPEDVQLSDDKIKQCFERKIDFYNIECRLIHKDGSIVWINDRGKVIEWTADGKPLIMAGTHTDITKRKNSELQFKTISDNIPGVVFRYQLNPDGSDKLSAISKKGNEIWGISIQEAMNNAAVIWNRCDKRDIKKHLELIRISAENLSYWKNEWRYHHPDGSIRWHRGSGNPIKLENGCIVWDSIILDITKEKDAEIELFKKEKKFRALVQEGSDMTAILDIQGKYLYLSDNYLIYTGYKPDFLMGKNGFDFFHPNDVEKIKKEYAMLSSEKRVKSSPYRFKKADGSFCWMQSVGTNLLDDEVIGGIVVNSVEITNLITTQKKLESHVERFEYVNKATNNAIYEYIINSDNIFWGESFERIFGHKTENNKFPIQKWKDLLHPDEASRVIKSLENALNDSKKERWIEEYRFKKGDGSYAYIKESGYIIRDKFGEAIKMIGVLSDITLLKTEEQRLLLMESVITNTHDAVLITEAEPLSEPGPRIIYANTAFAKMSGYEKDEIIGKSPRFLQGPKTDKKELNRISKLLRKGKAAETTLINYKKNGDEFWINFSMSPVKNTEGKLTHFISIERDVTDKMTIENEKNNLSKIRSFFNLDTDLISSLKAALHYLVKITDYDLAEIWLPNPKNNEIHLADRYTSSKIGLKFIKESEHHTFCQLEDDLPGKVWTNQTIELWKNIKDKKEFKRNEAAEKSLLSDAIGIPLFDNSSIVGVLVFASEKPIPTNITESTLFASLQEILGAEIKRKKQEEEMLLLFNSAPEIIVIRDPKGFFVKVNSSICELLGYTENELTSTPFIDFVHPDDVDKTLDVLHKTVVKKEQAFNFLNRYRCKNGSYKWISWTTSKSFGEHGLVFGFGRDVIQLKELEKILINATKLANFGSWEVDFINNTVYWSPMTQEIFEVSNEYQPEKENGFQLFKENYKAVLKKKIKKAINERSSFDFEAAIETKNGSEKWVRIIGDPEYSQNKCIKISGGIQDITKNKLNTIHLEKAYKEKKSILESIRDAFFSIDKAFNVVYCNEAARKLLMPDIANPVGKKLWSSNLKYAEIHYLSRYYDAFKKSEKEYFEEFYPDLNKWYEVSIYPTPESLSVYFKDITYRKKAELEIKQSNERFKKVAEATNDAIWEYDFEKDEILREKGYKKLFGYNLATVDASFNSFSMLVHDDDRKKVLQNFMQAITDPKKDNWFEEYRFLKANGEYALVIDRATFVRDDHGKAIKIYGAMTDISYRKEFEDSLKKLNTELKEQAKELEISNSELEQFAYIASHDLQEPLRMVTSFLSLLKKKYGISLDEKAIKYIDFALDGSKRMRKIILDLLEFSRINKLEINTEKVNLNELLEEVKKLQHQLIAKKNAQLIYQDLPVIDAHYSQVLQIFQNLIGNALKYSKVNQTPQIHVSVKKMKSQWKFSIEDNGIGIEEAYFDKIFIIFQRLHLREEYEGNGVGLAIVKKIIEKMGGKIWLNSKIGVGSTFFFTLPILNDEKS